MTFTVVWKPGAAAALAELWLRAPDRSEITAAADDIDAALRNRPLQVGEIGNLDTRILVRLPLAVVYDVQLEDRRVQILLVAAVPEE